MGRFIIGSARWLLKNRFALFVMLLLSTSAILSFSTDRRRADLLQQIHLRFLEHSPTSQERSNSSQHEHPREFLPRQPTSQAPTEGITKEKVSLPKDSITSTMMTSTTKNALKKPKTPGKDIRGDRYIIVQEQTAEELTDILKNDPCINATIRDLKKKIIVSMKEVNTTFLRTTYPEVKYGHFSPTTCTPTEKIALIIPYRDRHSHLFTLLPNLIPMLIKQGVDFTIFVIEQDLPTSFNKGVVYNAGFLEALKFDNYDCFIFHDVDMLPLSEYNLYRCDSRGPVHYMAGVNKFNYKLFYAWLIGGVLGLSKDQFQRVNGFSNLYFGWGAEDDDMGHRFAITASAQRRRASDGLNTVKYTLMKVEKTQLFIHVRIAVNMTEVYNTAPQYMRLAIKRAREEDRRNRIRDGTGKEVGYFRSHR